MRTFFALLALLVLPGFAQAQNYSDIWFNPAESGWGLTIADHQSNLFAVWFTYRDDGKPTWYVIPGGTFSNGHKHFEADIYATTGPAFSAPSFDAASVKATKVGTAVMDFASYSAATFSYNVGGVSQTKQIQRQPFGDASPVWGKDVSDIWWNPAESGWGLTLAQHGGNVFGVWFTYDTDGRPFWTVMPGVTFNGKAAFTGSLYTTTGPPFSSASFDSSQVVVKQEGNATVTLAQTAGSAQCGGTQSATLQTVLRGASRQTTICHQPFGDAPGPIDFPRAPGVPEGAALFQAPANPINATVATDDNAGATQVITPAGGTLSLTDAKGNKFALTFPPNAVLDDTAVTMTPITTLTGINYASGIVAGVKLEPDGLQLADMATLAVEPARPFPLINQTGFAAAGDGSDLHEAPPGPDYQKMQLYVNHFSFWGWLFMSSEERANEMRTKLASQNRARLMDWISRRFRGEKAQQVLGTKDSGIDKEPPPSIDQMKAWFQSYYDLVVTPRIQAAAGSCDNAMKAYDSVADYYSWRSKLIGEGDPQFQVDIENVRRAFDSLKNVSPCYFTETASYKALEAPDVVTATVTAYWKFESQAGRVITYKVYRGNMEIKFPADPPCKHTNPNHSIPEGARAFSKLDVDWDAGTYKGVGGTTPAITISCPDAATVTFPYALFYFGDRSSPDGMASGRLAGTRGGIGPETRESPLGTITYKFTTDCAPTDRIFCGKW